MSRNVIITLVVSLCAVSLSLHFAVESLGEFHGHINGGPTQAMFDSHEGDQFVLSELENGNPPQTWITIPSTSKPNIIIRSLPPLFPPPKSI